MTKPNDTIRVVIPLIVRKKNGRPKILPPADYLPNKDQAQDPHILRAIGRAWGGQLANEWKIDVIGPKRKSVADSAKNCLQSKPFDAASPTNVCSTTIFHSDIDCCSCNRLPLAT